MIDRRELGKAIVAVGATASLGIRPLLAAAPMVFRIGNAAGINDPQQIFLTCGRHPRLGYYQVEGVDFDFINVANPSQGMQAIATGEVTFASIAPSIFLPVAANDRSFPVISMYCWLPQNSAVICVKPDSRFNELSDLRGKRIGVRNLGDAGRMVMKSMFKAAGLDDTGTEYIAVGDVGPAGTALHRGQIDALSTYDTHAARIEIAGFKLREIPLTENFRDAPSGFFGFHKKFVAEHRNQLVGFLRALAKSTIFAFTNPEQGIYMHWDQYPESKPKGKSESEAHSDMVFLLNRRRPRWMPSPENPDQRMGATNYRRLSPTIELAGEVVNDSQLAIKLGDPKRVFSDELIADVNDFDRAAVVAQAKSFKL
jgi:NitT/TauT family transport system substrate-binding protein